MVAAHDSFAFFADSTALFTSLALLLGIFAHFFPVYGSSVSRYSFEPGGTNSLLIKNRLVDGIKTGYLAVEKYSLASSMAKNERRLIAVGSGFNSKNSRSRESTKLLTFGLTNYDLVEIAKANKPFHKIDVWLGKENSVDAYTKKDIYKTIKKAKKKLLKVVVKYDGPVEAPIKKDQKIATLRVVYDQELVGEYDLLSSKEIKKVNFFTRLIKSINYLIWGDV